MLVKSTPVKVTIYGFDCSRRILVESNPHDSIVNLDLLFATLLNTFKYFSESQQTSEVIPDVLNHLLALYCINYKLRNVKV